MTLKDLLDLAKDGCLFAWSMATGLARRAARGTVRAADRGYHALMRRIRGRSPAEADVTAPGAAPQRAPEQGRPASLQRTLLVWGIPAAALCVAGAIGGMLLGRYLMEGVPPPPPPPPPPLASHLFDRDGKDIATFALENRDYVKYADISPHVVNGLVAVEDERFWTHIGIDPKGITRAAVHDIRASIRAGRPTFPEGGSTLTQQLAKQLYTADWTKQFDRKITEMLYALHLEKEYQKSEILEMYLNKINLGAGNHGVEAASRFYFGKPCKDLTLAEGALIAGIGQAPTRLSPVANAANALKRRNHVLDRMVDAGTITREQAESAKAEPIVVATKERERRAEADQFASYFVEDIRKALGTMPETTGNVSTGGLDIESTIDIDLQRKATRAIREGLRRLDKQLSGFRPIARNLVSEGLDPETYEDEVWLLPPGADDVLPGVVLDADEDSATVRIGGDRVKAERDAIAWTKHKTVSDVLHRGDVAPFRVLAREPTTRAIERVQLEQDPLLNGSLVAIDVTSGEVLAMVGGYDFDRSRFNCATQAQRQAGSSFKPIYYACALQKGLRPSTTAIDEPTTFIDAWTGETYIPENYHKDYHGRVTVRTALEQSLNIPSVRILNYIGYKDAIATARRFGITVDLQPYPSMALGAFEMTLIEMTSAYATFPNGGVHVKPTMLRRVRDSKGDVLWEHQAEANEVVSPQVAWLMLQLMRGVVQHGTAKEALSLGRPIAGKTGTTDDYTDAWFVGYTPSVVVGVWTGYEKEVKTIGRDYSGARAALPIWIDFMRQYFEGRPQEDFVNPGGIDMTAIDRTTGLVASSDCPPENVLVESFLEENRPHDYCSAAKHRELELPRCLQRFGMDDAGWLVVPDEQQLFALEANPTECLIKVDPIERTVSYQWSPVAPLAQFSYRIGQASERTDPESIESLMQADRRTTRDGAHADFDVLDGRTVIIVRNDR